MNNNWIDSEDSDSELVAKIFTVRGSGLGVSRSLKQGRGSIRCARFKAEHFSEEENERSLEAAMWDMRTPSPPLVPWHEE